MDTRSKKFSHSLATKLIVFFIMIVLLSSAVKALADLITVKDGDVKIVFEDDYFHSMSFVRESDQLVGNLTSLMGTYKSEENILNGNTISADELRNEEESLYSDYRNSPGFNPKLTDEANREKFNVEYADEIAKVKERLINRDLREYHLLLQNIKDVKNPLYYASDGSTVYTNSTKTDKNQFKTYPVYMIFDGYKQEIYPKEIEANKNLSLITEQKNELDPKSQAVYIAFTDKFLNSKVKEWQENKAQATKNLYRSLGFFAGFILLFLYLVIVSGRKSFKDEKVHMHPVDKLFVDVNIVICIGLFGLWISIMGFLVRSHLISDWVYQITIPASAVVLVLILSLVRHFKNRTLFKHSLLYLIIHGIAGFVRNVYESGSVGVKTILIVIGYPLLILATFFMFPITIGIAAWFSFKKIQSFNAIKDGVERIKNGELHHNIEVAGEGEFAKLASNINSITDGLEKAVDSKLQSERLKTELITNVSHDIRTPLTSIITYVDLLKREKDPAKMEEYIEVLDQKSNRLKMLTDDLFDAAKASSGNIPVQLEQIDIGSLITQGLGEVSEKIEEMELDFRFNVPKEKTYIMADGKLLWRSIENVLSNIFKYALKGSRVYVNIEDLGNEVLLTFKNISAYELNIPADELMERFKRGDESRASQGSGLGLSIAKSLIDLQKGKFMIEIDGDLFKSMIYMPKP
ncbi:HAMP domain-containing sensor histidine kinase [Neobacillus sp. PS3-12]|uniref:sensor histidine kinase n=1 Tax=Neobacillus sp. PS3-12 TaxID=3070677 RepID=UPI0027E12045|nr:HAMP domain-containing sensor histidine kinase [Neobacillus sp. PS3-12]WML54987.1 HAMP domain-containing sensor histidine kinase [Neobacillus sp. PS3-12]